MCFLRGDKTKRRSPEHERGGIRSISIAFFFPRERREKRLAASPLARLIINEHTPGPVLRDDIETANEGAHFCTMNSLVVNDETDVYGSSGVLSLARRIIFCTPRAKQIGVDVVVVPFFLSSLLGLDY